MGTNFRYKIETIQTNNNYMFDIYVIVEYKSETLRFNTGIRCSQDEYINYLQNCCQTDAFLYSYDRKFKFNRDWIDIVLYHTYIQSINEPDKDYLQISKNKILNDVVLLREGDTFTNYFEGYLFHKYVVFDEDDVEDLYDPTYEEYMLNHRLLDCLMDYQIENYTILQKENYNIKLLYKKIKKYKTEYLEFNLEKEFKELLEWTYDLGECLIDDIDYYLIMDNKI